MPTISGTVYDHTGAAATGRIVRAYRRDTGAFLGQTTTGTGVVTPGDPSYANVSLLLHGDGAHDSTTIVDSSARTKGITLTSNSKIRISNGISKFGGGCILFPGESTDYVVLAPEYDYFFSTGSFTIESWIYLPFGISGSYAALYDARPGGTGPLFAINSARQLSYRVSGFSDLTTASAVPANAWTHIALCRGGGTVRLFIDGVMGASRADTTYFDTNRAVMGRVYDTAHPPFLGYVEDFRITKGVARYTADFTPPSALSPDFVEAPATAAGTYALNAGIYAGEVQRIVLDDDAGTLYNDLIDRVILS